MKGGEDYGGAGEEERRAVKDCEGMKGGRKKKLGGAREEEREYICEIPMTEDLLASEEGISNIYTSTERVYCRSG